MQEMFDVYEPDYGYIMDDMVITGTEPVSMAGQRFPKIEAEIAFILKDDLQGPGLSIADVLRATAGIMPSLEIIDTRYETFTLKIEDSVSDIASISKVVLGGKMIPIGDIDLRYTGLVFEKNGEVISTAAGAAVLGHPAASVAWLANKLGNYGVSLHKGDIIMSGSFIAACDVQSGDSVRAIFDHIGSVGIRFID
jgi:2-keto-4-pentenoate hydratase